MKTNAKSQNTIPSRPASAVNLLIGSRKFTEGWNSWRVSTMGLINFAKGEGSQAIQLFGRGVRLHGYNGCLKRSSKLDISKKPHLLPILETLTIFGIKAQYMEDFKKYLQDEGAPVNDNVFEFRLPTIKRYDELQEKKLQVLRVAPGKNFKKQAKRLIFDAPEDGLMRYLTRSRIVIDCRAKVQTIESAGAYKLERTALIEEHKIPVELLDYLDYQRIFEELEQYKNEKYYNNICIDASRFKKILQTQDLYVLLIPANYLEVNSIEKLFALTDYSILVLKNYMDRFFKYHKEKWESPFLTYQTLAPDDANFTDEYKIIYTPEYSSDPTVAELDNFLEGLKKLLDEKRCIPDYKKDFKNRIFAFDFRNHLYAPLICIKADGLQIQISPVALNSDEMRFVDYLKEYAESHVTELEGKSFYLLRNKSKTGLGFFEADNFYPDYILWLDTPKKQYISFIDPKGLTHIPWDSPKIMFYQKIKNRQTQMEQPKDKQIILNSFIMSGTPISNLKAWWPGTTMDDWDSRNVFCLDDNQCVKKMFVKILVEDKSPGAFHVRSAKKMVSRNTYHQLLIAHLLRSAENQTLPLEDLVACWAVLTKPEAIGEALPDRPDVRSWLKNYPDKIQTRDRIMTVLHNMIDRSMIAVGRDLKVSLFPDNAGPVSENIMQDASLALEAVRLLHSAQPESFCFAYFSQHVPKEFLDEAKKGKFTYAA